MLLYDKCFIIVSFFFTLNSYNMHLEYNKSTFLFFFFFFCANVTTARAEMPTTPMEEAVLSSKDNYQHCDNLHYCVCSEFLA